MSARILRRRALTGLVALVALSMLAGMTSPRVSAAEPPEAAAALEAVEKLVPAQLSAAPSVRSTPDGLVSRSGDATLRVPRDLREAISLTSPTAGRLGIRLASGGVSDRTIGDASVLVHENSLTSTDVVVQPLSGHSVRVMTVLKDRQAPTSFTYDLSLPRGASLAPFGPDPRAVAIRLGDRQIGIIDAPWAIDSAGRRVATSYRINGDRLIQEVRHQGAAYPVVADPRIGWGWNIYVVYSRSEVRSVAHTGVIVGVIALIGAACGKIPIFWLAAVCTVSLAVVSHAIFQTFQAAARENKCVELAFDYDGHIRSWKRFHC